MKFYHIKLDREILKYYWGPKIIISIFAVIFYKYIHFQNEYFLTPENIFQSPDIKVYLRTIAYSPLYSISVQFLTKFSFGFILKTFLSQLIVAFSCVSIYKSTKTLLKEKLTPLSLSLMAINPILVIYSFKFCTEIFALLGISILIRYRVKDIKLDKIKIGRSDLNYFFKLLIISLFRAQFVVVSFFEIAIIGISKYMKSNEISLNRLKNLIKLIVASIIFLSLINIFLQLNREYFDLFVSNLWDNSYPIKPKQIYEFLCNNSCSSYNFLIKKIIALLAYVIYIPISIILLTGARGRFTDLPWEINLGLIKIQSVKKILPGNNLEELLSNFDQNFFIITVITPLIILSIFHIIGYIFWIKNINKYSIFLWVSPIMLCVPPLLFYPYFRYFIPLIPLTCIGFSFFIEKLKFKNLKFIFSK